MELVERVHSPDVVMPRSNRWVCKFNSSPCRGGGVYTRPLLQPQWGTCAVVHAGCFCTEKAALARRVFVKKTEATKDGKKAFRAASIELSKRFGSPRLVPWSEEDVVSSAPRAKRAIYQRARESLFVKPLGAKDARVKMFVKPDKLTSVGLEPKKPRAIQGRTPRFNVIYGKYIKPIERYLCGWKGVHRGVKRTRVFAKGLNWEQRAKLVLEKLERFKYCVSLDASSFDASVRVWHLLGVHRVYKALIGKDPEFLFAMNETLVNTGVTAHGIWYKIVGNRMSGDMDTGIGNSILAFMLVWVAVKRMGLCKWDILCDGDDVLVLTDQHVSKEEWILQGAELGFDWKVEGYWTRGDPLEDIEFCRHRLVEVGGVWRFVRGIRALATFGVTHVHVGRKAHRRYMKGVAMSEMNASEGVPCASVLSAEVYKRTCNVKALFVHSDLYKFGSYVSSSVLEQVDMNRKQGRIEVSTRVSYERAFGVSVEEQERYEKAVPSIVEGYLDGDVQRAVDVVIEGQCQEWCYPETRCCVV